MLKFTGVLMLLNLLNLFSVHAFTPTPSISPALRTTPNLRPFSHHRWSMKIDYGVGYDPRNRPLRVQESNLHDMAMPAEPSPDQNAASHPRQDHESSHTVLHYGVIMLKVCIDSNSPGEPQNQPAASQSTLDDANIRYASSGYDPRARR